MKCPKKPEEKIVYNSESEADTIISFGECDGEDCAWWDEANGQCAVLVMAWRLDSVASMLGVLTNEKSRLT